MRIDVLICGLTGLQSQDDLKLFNTYRRLLKAEQPDMVITYSIMPNNYADLTSTLAQIIMLMYKIALRKAKTVF